MFDTADNSDPIDRIIDYTAVVLFDGKPGEKFTGGKHTVGLELLRAAARCFGGDDGKLVMALQELHSCDVSGDAGERFEDALAEWEDTSAVIYAKHSAMFNERVAS